MAKLVVGTEEFPLLDTEPARPYLYVGGYYLKMQLGGTGKLHVGDYTNAPEVPPEPQHFWDVTFTFGVTKTEIKVFPIGLYKRSVETQDGNVSTSNRNFTSQTSVELYGVFSGGNYEVQLYYGNSYQGIMNFNGGSTVRIYFDIV